MDPNTVLRNWIEGWATISKSAFDLQNWLNNDGFKPKLKLSCVTDDRAEVVEVLRITTDHIRLRRENGQHDTLLYGSHTSKYGLTFGRQGDFEDAPWRLEVVL